MKKNTNLTTEYEHQIPLTACAAPYQKVVLVVPPDEDPYFEFRCGVPGLMLAPHRLSHEESAAILLAFFVAKAKVKRYEKVPQS